MKEELETKQEWITPEIIDLDIENTSKLPTTGEGAGYGDGS